MLSSVELCCKALQSTKVTERTKGTKQIVPLLEKTIESLDEDDWRNVIASTYQCLWKDAEKYATEKRTKYPNVVSLPANGKLFFQIVSLGVREAAPMDYVKTFEYVKNCFETNVMSECYSTTFLTTLKDSLLPFTTAQIALDEVTWLELYQLLKARCLDYDLDKSFDQFKCLALLIKFGPLYSMPADCVRQEFSFITKMCQGLKKSSPRQLQEVVLEITLEFCRNTAADNRISCCKLGEDVFSYIICFYEVTTRDDKIKELIVEFTLLQVCLHNPKGVLEGHPAAYANNWFSWYKYLRTFLDLLIEEIKINLKCRNKNTSFFLVKNHTNFLSNSFVALYVEICHKIYNEKFSNIAETSPEPCSKRPKLNTCISHILDYICETKHWTWLQILYTLLEMYPLIIDKADYILLLLELNKISSESKDPDFHYHLNICLIALESVESSLEFQENEIIEVRKVWTSFGESLLKTIGLNQNSEQTENFLQRLINNKLYIFQEQTLFETLNPAVLKSEARILSIKTSCQNFSLNKSLKKQILTYLLDYNSNKNFSHFSFKVTGEVLVSLILKHWPLKVAPEKQHKNKVYPYEEIGDIYLKTALEDVIVPSKIEEKNEFIQEQYNIDEEMKEMLFKLIGDLYKQLEENNELTPENLLNVSFLFKNCLNYLIQFKIVDEGELGNFMLTEFLRASLEKFAMHFEDHKSFTVRQFGQFLEQFCGFLLEYTNLETLTGIVIPCVTADFLSLVFDLLRKGRKKIGEPKDNFIIKNNCMKLLTVYSLISNGKEISHFQQQAFQALVEDEMFDAKTQESYSLMLTFLKCLKHFDSKSFTENMVMSVLNFVRLLCQERYQVYNCAVEILEIMEDIFEYLDIARYEDCLIEAVGLLVPFNENRKRYGPKLSVNLINCLEYLYKVDPNHGFSKWISSTEIIFVVCELLKSDFQEVRFRAIKSISNYFKFFASNNSKEMHNKQLLLIENIFEASLNLFEFQVQGHISMDRQIDETTTRTSSVLQTFVSIILSSDSWLEEVLFLLFRISYTKQLNNFDRAMLLISNHLKVDAESLLDEHLEYILEKWYCFDFSLDKFPFKLFNCDNKIAFCVKYYSVLSPIVIIDQYESALYDLSLCMQKSVIDILKELLPKIFVNCLCDRTTNKSDNILEHDVLKNITEKISLDTFKQIVIDNVDVVCLCLLKHVVDDEKFSETFQMEMVFHKNYKNYLTVDGLLLCLNEINLRIKENFLVYLMKKRPKILVEILLNMKLTIEHSYSSVRKLKTFHEYFLFCQYVLHNFEQQEAFQYYFIRDFTFYLLHLMREYESHPKLSNVACKSYEIFLNFILPKHAACMKDFFHVVVSNLKNLLTKHSLLKKCCTNILEILIIENAKEFSNEIEILDPFPLDEQFGKINTIHAKLKYQNESSSLRKEILHFLKCGYKTINCDAREEGLKHLRTDLSEKKDELGELYKELYSSRGFSEDCEESLLHQLICMLIDLSASSQQNVSIEAMRTLGEIGVTDLSTLILKPDTQKIEDNWNPMELITGFTVSLLLQYIVDSDLKLVEVATKTLELVLNTHEGKKIAESEENFGFGAINNEFLFPFISQTKIKSSSSTNCINENAFIVNLTDDEIWCPSVEMLHETWIKCLICNILKSFTDKSYLPKLVLVCELKTEFCEKILSLLFYQILSSASEQCVTILSVKIGHFFSQHWNATIEKTTNKNLIATNKTSVKCMLDAVHFIRIHKDFLQSKKSKKLCLNYLHIAQAAQFCSAQFSAILYVELWCQSQFESLKNPPIREEYSTLDIIYNNIDRETAAALENILRNGYKNIGDLDALRGCGTSLVLNPQLIIQRHIEMNKWDQVLLLSDIALKNEKPEAEDLLIKAMAKCNLFESALFCTQSQTKEDQYECLWRLSQWDTIEKDHKNKNAQLTNCFEKYRYFALKSFHEKDYFRCEEMITNARLYEADKLKYTSLESCKNIYGILTKLQCLQELEEFANARKNNSIREVLSKWENRDFNKNEFQYIETIQAQRIVLLTDLIRQQPEFLDSLTSHMLNFAELAREENNFYVATRTITALLNLSEVSNNTKALVQLENAQLYWANSDKIVAKLILRYIFQDETVDYRIKSSALKLYGDWMAESLSENKNTIINDYYMKGLKVLTPESVKQDEEHIIDTYDKLGNFAYKQYQQVSAHIKSEGFQRKKDNINKSLKIIDDLEGLKKQRKLTKDEQKSLYFHKQQSSIDQKEIEHTENEKNKFVRLCLKYYLLHLKHSDKSNIRIFRVMSIFLENRNNEVIFEYINKYLPQLASYKYITMLPQIIPHISNKSDVDLYTKMCNFVIKKCAVDHPHHTLPLLFSLYFATEDSKYSTERQNAMPETVSRKSCAHEMLKDLKKNKKLTRIIARMELLSEALIQLAYETRASDNENHKFVIPRKMKILNVKDFDDVLLPTFTLPMSKNCEYNNLIGISSFKKEFYNVGGINAPKRIFCVGTDGKSRPQLIKGQDDLRQDAVMQQVFTIMNSLLAANNQTKNLVIRTYKVVPLSMRSGILEWVENSMPLGEYLLSAHEKYRPQDKSARDCRNIFKNMAKSSADVKLQKYKEICKNFKPVFHKFFETSFLQPAIWYERRRAYTNSVATTSMCGYILGIGDRHVQNILIDKSTAEFIHIDFGIAFEQGRILPTPETIPFRLTRDVVDGMGVSGIEGIFRRSCEKTMEVMRQNSETILTILEVLLYDPLYSWTVTSAEANRRQTEKDDSDEVDNKVNFCSPSNELIINITAERALLRLRGKLHGIEEGSPTSIEHQVGTLIQNARDPTNLCRVFQGWQPYL